MPLSTLEIKKICQTLGADLVGITPVERFGDAPEYCHPLNVLTDCRSVIVLASLFPPEALWMDTVSYTHIRNGMVKKMNEIATLAARSFRTSGMMAKPVLSTTGKWINGRFYGPISLKHAAEAAGLGRIGKNYLLTNDRYGNMIWLSAVVTNSTLHPDQPAGYEVCDNCNLCIEKCPSKALGEAVLNHSSCRRCCYKTAKGVLDLKCWNCRKVCPNTLGIKNEK